MTIDVVHNQAGRFVRVGGLLILMSLFTFPLPAQAALACSLSMTAIAFGNVDVTAGSAVDTTGTLTLSCTGATVGNPLIACLDINGGSAFDATSRLMNGPGPAQLRFQLYSDAARTTQWGSWAAGLYGGGLRLNLAVASTTPTYNITNYGRALANQQTITAGAYSSSLTLTGNYRNGGAQPACPVAGAPSSTSFNATATVTKVCTITATNLGFGSIGVLGANVDATSAVTATCTNGTPYNIGLNAGTGTGATVANRKMTNAGNTVTYSLYSNSVRTTVWGTTIGTNTVAGTGSGSNQNLSVYGRIPVQTTPAPATYSDTVVVTVTY